MNLRTKTEGSSMIVYLSGKIMGGLDSKDLTTVVKDALSKGIKQFVFDLREVEWLNSTGLSGLIACWMLAKKAEGQLVLTGLSDRSQLYTAMSGLSSVVAVYRSNEEALSSFKRDNG